VTNVGQGDHVESRATPLSDLSATRIWGMLESAPDGMLMTDGDGVILAVNEQVERLFGYERADILGRHVEILLPERLREIHRAHRTRYRAEPNVRAMGEGLQLRARRSNGSEFPVEVSLSPLHDDEGLAVVASIRDVSERARTSAHIRRIQAAIDAVHDGVFMFEPDTLRFVYANDGASTQTGYTHDELLTMTPLHIKPGFTREQFATLIAPLVAGEVEHLSFRTIHRAKSGRDVPVDIMLEHRRSADAGRREDPWADDSLLVAIARDVTEQVAVETALALSEETFRTSFEHAPVGMAIARLRRDGTRVIEQANTSFAGMLGRTVESLAGLDFVQISHPDDKQQSIDAWAEMADGERSAYMTEQRYLRADGSAVWALVHSSVIERSDGVRTLTHIVDITDRRERQAERTRLTTMEDRERIARDIHDLVIQRLFGAGMKLQAVIPEMGSDTAIARTHETIDELDTTIRELRSAIFSLHHRDASRSATDELALAVAQSVDRLGFRPDLVVEGPLDAIADDSLTELLATLREALSNAARHAHASTIDVRIEVAASALSLTVADDGGGVAPDHPHGNGLKNLAARASRLGGSFRFGPAAAGGCELIWTVPR
jgi:two-component system sensor histidine kinase DevS